MRTEKEIRKKFDRLRTEHERKNYLFTVTTFMYFLNKFEEWLLKGDEMVVNDYIRGVIDLQTAIDNEINAAEVAKHPYTSKTTVSEIAKDLIDKERERVIKDLETAAPKESKHGGWHVHEINSPTIQKICECMSDEHEHKVYVIRYNPSVITSPSLSFIESSFSGLEITSIMDFTLKELTHMIHDKNIIFVWFEYVMKWTAEENEGGKY